MDGDLSVQRRRGSRRRSTTVTREGAVISFRGRVDDIAVRDFLNAVTDARERGYLDLTLDFSQCERAYPDAMLTLICVGDRLADEDVGIDIRLPANDDLARLFQNTNWAHCLDPSHHEAVDFLHERHMRVRRYASYEDQQDVVNGVLDVVMRNMELDRNVLGGLEWSLNEITDNVLNHADSGDLGGLVQVTTFPEGHRILFVVADAGRGIPTSMREGHPELHGDADAILEALKAGVTRNPDIGQGNGLAGTLRVATMSGGSMDITSGHVHLAVRKPAGADDYEQRVYRRTPGSRFDGTVVAVSLRTDAHYQLTDALGFQSGGRSGAWEPWDVVDANYQDESGNALRLRLSDERTGFGTRQGGQQIRTKIKNLLAAEPAKRIVLDWSGVPLISSSFADEAIGRLFVELGPMSFVARIENVFMEPLVRSLIDRAVMQRVGQAESGR